MYFAEASLILTESFAPSDLLFVDSADTTSHAVSGKFFGGVRTDSFRFLISAFVFLTATAFFCFSVNTFFAFGLDLAFGLGLALGFALGLVSPVVFGIALGLFVRVAVLVVAFPVAWVAFCLGVFVVLPVCALGLDAGLVAYVREVDELPLGWERKLWRLNCVEYGLDTRARLVGVKATQFVVKSAAVVDCGRRTNDRTIRKIMAMRMCSLFRVELNVDRE